MDTPSLSRLLSSSSNVSAHLLLRPLVQSLRPLGTSAASDFRISNARTRTYCAVGAPCPTQAPGVLNFDTQEAGPSIEHQATTPSLRSNGAVIFGAPLLRFNGSRHSSSCSPLTSFDIYRIRRLCSSDERALRRKRITAEQGRCVLLSRK